MMPKGWGDNAQAVGNTSLCGLMTFPVKSVGFEKIHLSIIQFFLP